MPMTIDDVRTRLAPIRATLENLGVVRFRVFGSVARGAAWNSSDVDCLLYFDQTPSLFTLARTRDAMSNALGVPVDVATASTLRESRRSLVEAESLDVT